MAPRFRFEPNWQNGVTITREFKTEILTSREFREQRIAERIYPRISVEFDINLMRNGSAFLAEMSKSQQGIYSLQDWTRHAVLSAQTLTGESDFTFDAAPGWLMDGQEVLLVSDDAEEVYTVASQTSTVVTVEEAVTEDWPVGAKMYPLWEGVFAQSLRGSLLTSRTGRWPMDFRVNPGTYGDTIDETYAQFNGRPLWLKPPNWRTAPGLTLKGYLETVDFDAGVVDHYAPVGWNTLIQQFQFLLKNPAEAEDLVALFNECKGQRGEFYYPTWRSDFDLGIGASSGSNVLDMPGTRFAENFAGSTVYKAAIAFFYDGTYQANRISAITDVDPNSRATFVSNWSKAINSTTTRQMCFLPVHRFASDELALEWLTSTVAETKLSLMTLEDL